MYFSFRFWLFIFIINLNTSFAKDIWDNVRRVVDGDTVVLENLGTVRLIGVDTPETVHPKKPVEHFGREASNFTKSLLSHKKVRVQYDWNKTDKYKRTLVYLYLEDGTFVNLTIIAKGYGHAYTRFPFKYLEDFRTAERKARESSLGLWGIAAPEEKKVAAIPTLDQHKCSIKKPCSKMSSCEEAKFYLNVCGHKERDGDGDGIPCHNVCKK